MMQAHQLTPATEPGTPQKQVLWDLPQITLCCIDTRSHSLAIAALKRSMAQISFGRVLLISDEQALKHDLDGIELDLIPPIKSIEEYSSFALKKLRDHITTPYVLLIQWDGFIINPSNWSDRFTEYDYIGAPWVDGKMIDQIGNGGFSLRSKKLLEALHDPDVETENPEDVCICINNRVLLEEKYGIKFAPVSIAKDFSCERGEIGQSFGFHGLFNFDGIFSKEQLRAILEDISPNTASSPDARNLIKRLIKKGDTENSLELISKRIKKQGPTWDNLQLKIRAKFKTALKNH
jgi:hypothetical protein